MEKGLHELTVNDNLKDAILPLQGIEPELLTHSPPKGRMPGCAGGIGRNHRGRSQLLPHLPWVWLPLFHQKHVELYQATAPLQGL